MHAVALHSDFQVGDATKLVASEVSIPQFEIEKSKWSRERLQKVEALAEAFQKRPNLLLAFEDSKLKKDALVLLRKKHFEELLNILRDINEGQVGLQFSAEKFQLQLGLLEDLIEEKFKSKQDSKPLRKAFKLLHITFSEISSRLFVFSDPKRKELPPLSPEELELLDDEDEDDE